MSFTNIIEILNKNILSESELDKIVNVCNKKLKELNNELYKNEINKLIENINDINIKDFINNIKYLSFYDKFINNVHSYNIKIKYCHFIITLSHKISFCDELGCITKDNSINIIDTHQETCYNLWNNNMLNRFMNIINLDANENDVKQIIIIMFQVYQPDENIKW
jgi:hypothetical protein